MSRIAKGGLPTGVWYPARLAIAIGGVKVYQSYSGCRKIGFRVLESPQGSKV